MHVDSYMVTSSALHVRYNNVQLYYDDSYRGAKYSVTFTVSITAAGLIYVHYQTVFNPTSYPGWVPVANSWLQRPWLVGLRGRYECSSISILMKMQCMN